MAKKKERYSYSDQVAARTNMPGSRPQTPTEESTIRGVDGSIIDKVRMNFAGIAGGLPTSDASTLRQRAKAYDKEGATSSAAAARTRARNVDAHADDTAKAKKEIKRRKLKADAEKPGAGMYAKARAKLNAVTGFKKGGSVSSASKRADGCATKGKTRGKVC